MGFLEMLGDVLKGKEGVKKGDVQKCPQCKETILLTMDRCPKCGTHIKSMFRRKCPKCASLNQLDAKVCVKCNYNFEAELKRAEQKVYICPRCGFRMDAFLTACPACNTRFM